MDPTVDASSPAPGSRDRSRVALTVALAAGLVLSVTLFALVSWVVAFAQPRPGGLRAGSAWAALVSGLVLTGLVAAYVRTLTTRTARMEREVVLRTAELSASNASHRDHARRLATLAEVTRSFTTALDPAAVARHILEAARVLIPGAAGRLWEQSESDETFHQVASVGLRDHHPADLDRLRPGEGLVGVAATTREPVIVTDLATDPRFRNRAWAEAEGLVAAAVVPLVHGDRFYGALAIVTREAHEFSADEVALLRTFPVHAAIAIANARLHDSALRRARLLATLNDLSRRLTTTLDPTAVAGEILAAAQVLIPGAGADLWERIEGREAFRAVASVGFRDPEEAARTPIRLGRGIAGVAAATGRTVVSPDLAADPRVLGASLSTLEGFVSGLAVPLARGTESRGVLCVFTRERHVFTPEEIGSLEAF